MKKDDDGSRKAFTGLAHKVKNLPTMQGTPVRSLGLENPLEKGMETHSSILAWRIPWTEEPGGLQPIGSQRVRHDRRDLECTQGQGRKQRATVLVDISGIRGGTIYPSVVDTVLTQAGYRPDAPGRK